MALGECLGEFAGAREESFAHQPLEDQAEHTVAGAEHEKCRVEFTGLDLIDDGADQRPGRIAPAALEQQ